jgi:hypothetical protein
VKKNIVLILSGVLIIAFLVWIGVFIVQKTDRPGDNVQAKTEQDYLISLGNQLYIHKLVNIKGTYVEDGKNETVEKVAAITVENRGNKTLQLGNISLEIQGVEYVFSLTTLPPGKTAMVQEKQKRSFPKMDQLPEAKLEYTTFFEEEPSLHQNVFEITTSAFTIEVTNKTDTDIVGPIYVYYKTVEKDYFRGGITYRVHIPAIAAGETYTAYAGHFYGQESQVMYIDYAK